MSEKNAQHLMVEAEKDPTLAEKLSTLDPTAVARWAETRGYELTPDEAERLTASFHELSDEDLEQVAGGWSAGSNEPCGP